MLTSPAHARAFDAIVIGGSSGAIEALGVILPVFGGDVEMPIVVMVHLPANRPSLLVELFSPRCSLPCREPDDKEPVLPGIWFAPADYHLLVERDGTFSYSVDDPVNYSRPSIDVLFESAAFAYGARVIGVILTGANGDGALGACAIREAGGLVMVQDPTEARAKTMPMMTENTARPQVVGTLQDIAQRLQGLALGRAS